MIQGQRIVHGYGSAGDGSRALRHTQINGLRMGTYTAEHRLHAYRSVDVRLDDPPADVLWDFIHAMDCWWCGRGPFRSLSSHWTRAHHLDLQHIRDILGVRKNHSFIDEALRDTLQERGRRNYDQARLHSKGNPRQLCLFGSGVQRVKSVKAKQRQIEFS